MTRATTKEVPFDVLIKEVRGLNATRRVSIWSAPAMNTPSGPNQHHVGKWTWRDRNTSLICGQRNCTRRDFEMQICTLEKHHVDKGVTSGETLPHRCTLTDNRIFHTILQRANSYTHTVYREQGAWGCIHSQTRQWKELLRSELWCTKQDEPLRK